MTFAPVAGSSRSGGPEEHYAKAGRRIPALPGAAPVSGRSRPWERSQRSVWCCGPTCSCWNQVPQMWRDLGAYSSEGWRFHNRCSCRAALRRLRTESAPPGACLGFWAGALPLSTFMSSLPGPPLCPSSRLQPGPTCLPFTRPLSSPWVPQLTQGNLHTSVAILTCAVSLRPCEVPQVPDLRLWLLWGCDLPAHSRPVGTAHPSSSPNPPEVHPNRTLSHTSSGL